MTGDEAAARARSLFGTDTHAHGCAETAFVVLKEAFGLPDAADSSAAMALNGGVAYSGGMCGAITGSALAVGLLAERRSADHATAKRLAREIIARLMDEFEREYGALDCRVLIGRDLRSREQHDAFLASDIWKTVCMGQLEFAVRHLAALPEDPIWSTAVVGGQTG